MLAKKKTHSKPGATFMDMNKRTKAWNQMAERTNKGEGSEQRLMQHTYWEAVGMHVFKQQDIL